MGKDVAVVEPIISVTTIEKPIFSDIAKIFEAQFGSVREVFQKMEGYDGHTGYLSDLTVLLDQMQTEHLDRLKNLGARGFNHEEELEMQRITLGALTKTSLLLQSFKENATVDEMVVKYLGEEMGDDRAKSMNFDMVEDLETARDLRAAFPDLKTANKILGLELLVRGLYNQRQLRITDEQADAWVTEMYRRMAEKAKERASSSTHEDPEMLKAYTDTDRAAVLLKNALTSLKESGFVGNMPRILIVGPGLGKVEGQAIEDWLGADWSEGMAIDAVDPEPQVGAWEKMNLIRQTLVEYADDEANQGKEYEVIISIGSGLHNDYSLHDWLEENMALTKLSAKNAIVIVEAGAIDPGEENKRRGYATAFNRDMAKMMIGLYGPIREHQLDENIPEMNPAVIMFPSIIYDLFATMSEGRLLNYPLQDPLEEKAHMIQLREESNMRAMKRTDYVAHQDPLEYPFWIVGNVDDIRGMWIWQAKSGDVEGGQAWSDLLKKMELLTRPYFVPDRVVV